ncbi:MAG: hypothetical protein IPL40_11485 [Proteobacteria bacterium]|nr:hypothetical protein [Pseudomonadota bacterium]
MRCLKRAPRPSPHEPTGPRALEATTRAALSLLVLGLFGGSFGCATGGLGQPAAAPTAGGYSLYELSMPPDDGRLAAELHASRLAAAEARRLGRPCPEAPQPAPLDGAVAVNCYRGHVLDPLAEPEPLRGASASSNGYRTLRQRELTAERMSGISGMTGRVEFRRAWSASDLGGLARFQ